MTTKEIKTYEKRSTVAAVKLDLDMDPLHYRKWGGNQTAKPGDWLVLSNDQTYTIDADEFARTYAKTHIIGQYRKIAPTYAWMTLESGEIATLEGVSQFKAGDFICASNREMKYAYPVSQKTFRETYVERPI